MGFLFGLLISEVARIISDCIDRGWFKGQICKKNKRIRSYRYNRIEKSIEKSGIAENAIIGKDAEFLRYLPAIYGVVQSDESYKRIHNYASSETMYKI